MNVVTALDFNVCQAESTFALLAVLLKSCSICSALKQLALLVCILPWQQGRWTKDNQQVQIGAYAKHRALLALVLQVDTAEVETPL